MGDGAARLIDCGLILLLGEHVTINCSGTTNCSGRCHPELRLSAQRLLAAVDANAVTYIYRTSISKRGTVHLTAACLGPAG